MDFKLGQDNEEYIDEYNNNNKFKIIRNSFCITRNLKLLLTSGKDHIPIMISHTIFETELWIHNNTVLKCRDNTHQHNEVISEHIMDIYKSMI